MRKLKIIMPKVFHTPGSFGNYISYLLDCKENGSLLDAPFTSSGSSHKRKGNTQSYDIVLTDAYNQFTNATSEDFAIFWEDRYFFLILHSAYGRTNDGQYGECGVRALEQNTYQWYKMHDGHGIGGNDLDTFIGGLETYFNFKCDIDSQKVPAIVLQNYFFLHFVKYFTNKMYIKNTELKTSKLSKINLDDILDYHKLKDRLGIEFDFEENHAMFIKKNLSLKALMEYRRVVTSVIDGNSIEIPDLDIITKTGVLYALETYYSDIPFHNTNFNFTNTGQIIDYIKAYPQYMKMPNKLFSQNWRVYNDKKLDL